MSAIRLSVITITLMCAKICFSISLAQITQACNLVSLIEDCAIRNVYCFENTHKFSISNPCKFAATYINSAKIYQNELKLFELFSLHIQTTISHVKHILMDIAIMNTITVAEGCNYSCHITCRELNSFRSKDMCTIERLVNILYQNT